MMKCPISLAIPAACLLLCSHKACTFTLHPSFSRSLFHSRLAPRPLFATAMEEAQALKAQAERMRLEAEKMDAQLTLEKVQSLERKLNDKTWREKHPEQEAELREKLQDLNNKIQGKPPIRRKSVTSTTREDKRETRNSKAAQSSISQMTPRRRKTNEKPIAGFDPDDLKLYLPVARSIEERMANATMEEKLDAFRQTPELQKHFSDKIQELLVQPMQELSRLEAAKREYLQSTSSVEREQLKREIHQLEAAMEKDSPFLFPSSVYREVPKMSDDELQERLNAIKALPEVMQCLYKKRNDVPLDSDLRLAILLEHYEPQLQLLEQVQMLSPLDDESRQEAIKGYTSLPLMVQEQFCKSIGLDPSTDAATVVEKLEGGASELNLGFGKVVVEAAKQADLPEYSDIEFVDRSRYIEEFIPAIPRMEATRPTPEEIELFSTQILDRDTFTLTSKPERVMGGYYLRGESKFENDGDKLVEKLTEKLAKSSLKDDLQFFYIPDPSPLTDEEIEAGIRTIPLLAVTSKNSKQFYNVARPQIKALVSSLGIVSTFVFALGSCGMNGDMMELAQQGLDSGNVDVSWFADAFFTTFISMLGIQAAHELGHRIIAWRDKFDLGVPNLIPSITLGLTGSITPLKSPPKNWDSMFDLAVAGPVAGFAASLFLLVEGLGITASMDMSSQSQLPALPGLLLHASALGGGLVEYFLGSGVLSSTASETVLPLHPFAIAGYIGLITNALALLPLGHTDGGRMAMSIFGRRGFFLVKSLSLVAICVAGLFGLDNSEILLLYALYVVLWQRELETPALNEVDDLDTFRGLAAFPIAVLVALTLLPLP